MALSRGVKIVLGCVVVLVLVVGGIGVALFGAAWWGLGKVKQAAEQFQTDQKRVDENLARANANAFSEPADGVVAESRLVRFLAVRKHLYGAYEKHKDMIEAQANKKDVEASALLRLPGIVMELQAARAEGLAQQDMSEDEFRWLFGAVYRNMAVAGIGAQSGGPSASEAVRAVTEQAVEQAENAARAAEADPNVPAEAKRQLRDAADKVRQESALATESTRSLDLPPANKALFEKHKDEILRYTMGGLEWLSI